MSGQRIQHLGLRTFGWLLLAVYAITAVGWTPATQVGSGYSTGITDSKATCGSRTITRHGGPPDSCARSALQSTTAALDC